VTAPEDLELEAGRTWPVIVLMGLLFVGIGATLPALPAAVREAGAGPTSLGLVIGVFPLAALTGRLGAGRSTDRRGRVVTMRVGLITAAVSGVLFALPVLGPTVPVAGIGVARVLHGLANALVYTAVSAYVLDRTLPARRPQALSLLGAGIWGGYALGPLLGAALGLAQVGLVVLAGSLVGLALTVGLPDTRASGDPPTGLRALLPRGVALPGLALGLGNLGYAAIIGFLVVRVDDGGGRGAVALTCFSIAVLAGRLVVVPVAARLGMLRSLPYGLVSMAAGLLVIAATDDALAAGIAAAVIGIGYCLPYPALASLVAGRVPASQRGAALGALVAFYDVFVGLGSVVFGLVAARAGTPSVFVLAAVGVLASAVVNTRVAGQDRGARTVADARPPDA